jgi:Ser/Thr protein kinase RdoA (MazF antagonist)
MAVKTSFSQLDFEQILSQYDLGIFNYSEPITQGTVQTNYYLHTGRGKYVFRYYENRTKESVLFERDLLIHLKEHHYPCPGPIRNRHGKYVVIYQDKPYMIFDAIEGVHLDRPSAAHKQELIQKAAELQISTQDFQSAYQDFRWNYDPTLCSELANTEAQKIGTDDAWGKFEWLEKQLIALELPDLHPKGICHCDFHFSNVLFQGDRFGGLIDFDDANFTYLTFDLVCLIDGWAWLFPSESLNLEQAQEISRTYEKYRPLSDLERHHLFDVHKLGILFDCIWFFGRGSASEFYERKKIDYLDVLGRDAYERALFSN